MRLLSLCTLLSVACTSQNSTFSSKGDDNTTLDQGVGQLSYSPDTLLITDVQIGFAKAGTLTITSSGDNTLRIDSISLSNAGEGVFYVEERSDLSLAPEQSTTVDVVANFENTGFVEGELRIRSNDADYRDLRIPVCAVTEDYTAPYSCGSDTPSPDTATPDTGGQDSGSPDTGEDTDPVDSGTQDSGIDTGVDTGVDTGN